MEKCHGNLLGGLRPVNSPGTMFWSGKPANLGRQIMCDKLSLYSRIAVINLVERSALLASRNYICKYSFVLWVREKLHEVGILFF